MPSAPPVSRMQDTPTKSPRRRLRWIGRILRPLAAHAVGCTQRPRVEMVRDPSELNRYTWKSYAASFRREYGENGLWVVTFFGGKVGFASTLPEAREIIERLEAERIRC